MRKIKLYLDTSVISFYFAEDAPEKMAITRKFFDQELASGNYEIKNKAGYKNYGGTRRI